MKVKQKAHAESLPLTSLNLLNFSYDLYSYCFERRSAFGKYHTDALRFFHGLLFFCRFQPISKFHVATKFLASRTHIYICTYILEIVRNTNRVAYEFAMFKMDVIIIIVLGKNERK